jgi:hypothetical protein
MFDLKTQAINNAAYNPEAKKQYTTNQYLYPNPLKNLKLLL